MGFKQMGLAVAESGWGWDQENPLHLSYCDRMILLL